MVLENVSSKLGFISFKTGSILCLILFRTYFIEALLWSSRQAIPFSFAKDSISFLENFNNGRMIFPLTSGIPVKPSKPLPLVKFIKKVSKLSSA